MGVIKVEHKDLFRLLTVAGHRPKPNVSQPAIFHMSGEDNRPPQTRSKLDAPAMEIYAADLNGMVCGFSLKTSLVCAYHPSPAYRPSTTPRFRVP